MHGLKMVDSLDKADSKGCLPSKKLVLSFLLLVTIAGILVLSAYADLGTVSIATASGRNWVSKMLVRAQPDVRNCPGSSGGNGSEVNGTTIAACNTSRPAQARAQPVTSVPRPPLGPGQTYSSFDNSTIITCSPAMSPFVFCGGVPAQRTPAEKSSDAMRRRPWKIADIRRAKWQPNMNFANCRYSNCVNVGSHVTPDTDVVHVMGVGLNSGFPRPPRSSNQLWMFSAWESPHHTHADFLDSEKSPWNGVFNLSMSYRVDSDIFAPYGLLAFQPTPVEKRPNYLEIARGKTRSVAWFVSNCQTPSKRQNYVRELKKYIDVDVYGACGTPCAKTNGQCTKDLPVKYKFYLSFENSICTDYISEKLFKIYAPGMHVIPVTRGKTPYAKYFPENTFIDAADFSSPKQLAEHLKRLGSDLHRYSRMLEFKDQYRCFGGLGSMWCSLCEVLNTRSIGHKTYNMKSWFGYGQCVQPRDFG